MCQIQNIKALTGKDDRDGYMNSYLVRTNLHGANLWGAKLNAVVLIAANVNNDDLIDPRTVKHFKVSYIPIIDSAIDQNPFAMLVDLQKSFHWI